MAQWQPRVLAVTGSVGKTTVKRILAGLLAGQVAAAVAPGNLNSEYGVPIAVANSDPSSTHLVLEFAMRGPGQVRYLAEMVQPHVAAVTNIGISHMEILGSQQAIAAAKREIFEAMDPQGTACVNLDDPYAEFLMAGVAGRTLTFGLTKEADLRAESLRETNKGIGFDLIWQGMAYTVELPVPGRHQVSNALCACAMALAAGIEAGSLPSGLLQFAPEAHRGVLLEAPLGYEILDDCYNAAPHSMRAALAVLASRPCAGRRIAVLGDMLELGDLASTEHRALGRAVYETGVDLLVTVGSLGRLIGEGAVAAGLRGDAVFPCEDREEAAETALGLVCPGDVVLVKGSRGLALEHVVNALMVEEDVA